MTKRIGYVGLDHHHRAPYIESIQHLDAEVTAVADPDTHPEDVEADSLTEVPYYRDVPSLLDGADVDLLWVTLSNRETPAAIEAAVERGVDVFTEKPAARSASEFEPVAEAVAASDATVGFSYAWRGHPFSKRLADLVARGHFGDVKSFDVRFVASQLATRNTDHYLFDRAASRGGIVQWLGVHWIDLVPWILDDPIVRVNARMRADTPAVDVEDGAVLQFETASGILGSHTCGYYLGEGRYDTEVKLYGEQGSASWDPMGPTFGFDGETELHLSKTDETGRHHEEQLVHDYRPVSGYGGEWGLAFMDQFLAACDGRASNPADVTDAMRVLRVLDAAYESDRTGEWVAVERE
ncbi:Gfo/Idh/MocA family protein [Haladaptatus sp. DYSN1]|uniref:Gfo/Idh/MocA family protein n=1 Tax=unclassified Haladaptatus TaxID=2622732 RepID=UPI0024054B37|nr:Gfo/Idh/MocA family oxidoreductase [Haladaptatus sp. DYSN1]